ncbi:hypothetical protein [Labrenzia sp. CE80]|uniref:hypothetical protein n=1 Tax=Labrenzia sp. CE80 TaxID=1788986 RepID=UPI00129A6D4E|nr:hypothetical protein [Labrenzia sp. CE80]
MMNLKSATTLLLSGYLIFATMTIPAKALSWCSLSFSCEENLPSGDARRSFEGVNDPVISDKDRAKNSANNKFLFYRYKGKESDKGYVRINYNFIGKKEEDEEGREIAVSYVDSDPEAKDFFKRSIVAWAKSLFKKEKRKFIVTLTAESRGEVFWIEPVFSFETNEDSSNYKYLDSKSFNGHSLFYRKSDEEIKVKLNVMHTRSDEIDVEFIEEIFEAGSQLASTVAGVTPLSLADDVMAIAPYRTLISSLKEKLSKFESVRGITRNAVLKRESGKWIGFQYHFLAPKVEYTPFKLNVELEYKDSLLDNNLQIVNQENSILNSRSVMEESVKAKGASSTIKLSDYFRTNPTSSDVREIFASPDGKALVACEKLTKAAAEIFQPHDIALAVYAYIDVNTALIGAKKDPGCFKRDARYYINKFHLPWLDGFKDDGNSGGTEVFKLKPYSKYFDNYVSSFITLLKAREENVTFIETDTSIFVKQGSVDGNSRGLKIEDKSGLFNAGSEERRFFPENFIANLLRVRVTKAGCIQRTIYSNDNEDPNVFGLLFEFDHNLFEAILYFDATPKENIRDKEVIIDKISFNKVDAGILSNYENAHSKQACRNSGWKPWDHKF